MPLRTDLDTVTALVAALKAFVVAANVHNAGIVPDTTCEVTFAAAKTQAAAVLLRAETPA